ncbi:hypothetical protein QTH87_00485 [Variovorax sp. J22P168]|uniref:hypothetical protein n=1 Tax=Variovorax jilinensis TaxID=3053513 RepID=UPI00257784B3|nr:hypothetical protein [Variovorax sp. J22P168]MDM0010900.1 hypothetical protein [Variovorax sp. J22P168]
MDRKLLDAITREAVVKAGEREVRKQEFMLSGRGHKPRVTFNRNMAALLKQCNLPRVTIFGYCAKNFYPPRVFTSARTVLLRKLGWAPFEISRDSTVYMMDPPSATKLGPQP